MTLQEYMRKKKLTDQAMADLVGDIDRSRVNRFRRGLGYPSVRTLARIQRVTNGKVTAVDFVTSERNADGLI